MAKAAYAEYPGPIEDINPEVTANFFTSSDEFPFYVVNEVTLKSSSTRPFPHATIQVKAVFEGQTCNNTARPKDFLVSRKWIANGELKVTVTGLQRRPKDAAIYGICALVRSPTYIKFDLQVNHEGSFAPGQLLR